MRQAQPGHCEEAGPPLRTTSAPALLTRISSLTHAPYKQNPPRAKRTLSNVAAFSVFCRLKWRNDARFDTGYGGGDGRDRSLCAEPAAALGTK